MATGWDKFIQAANVAATWWSSQEQQNQTDQANERTDQQYADMLGWAQQGMTESQRLYDQGMGQAGNVFGMLPAQSDANRLSFLYNFQGGANDILGGYDDRYGYAEGETQDILGGYDDRYRFAQGQIENYGIQQAEDIDRRFDEEQARSRMALGSRGLLSSTEAANQGLGVAERRSAEQRRLQESLMSSRVDILSGLSGDRLGAQEGALEFLSQMSQQGLGAQQGLFQVQSAYDAAMRGDTQMSNQLLGNYYMQNAQGGANLYNQNATRMINTIGGINFIPPPPNQLPFMFGQNSVQGPSSPDAPGEYWAARGVDTGRAFWPAPQPQ